MGSTLGSVLSRLASQLEFGRAWRRWAEPPDDLSYDRLRAALPLSANAMPHACATAQRP